jgi:hypothetical protein
MDFVERWFGVFPDGGTGTFEASIIFAVLISGGVLGFRRKFQTALYIRRFVRAK